jgi:alkylhydroperoxidase/carboxymuconolactone decarboxylase family protein YurZ
MDVNQALSAKQQSIIPIAAFTANGDLAKLRTALHDGLDAGLTVNEIKEILVHNAVFYRRSSSPGRSTGSRGCVGHIEQSFK